MLAAMLTACSSQLSENTVIRRFKMNKKHFEHIAEFIENYEFGADNGLADKEGWSWDDSLYRKMFGSHAQRPYERISISIKGFEWIEAYQLDEDMLRSLKKISSVKIRTIKQMGTPDDKTVIYFIIDDYKRDGKVIPHGIAYLSGVDDPIKRIIDDGAENVVNISDNWYYYTCEEYDYGPPEKDSRSFIEKAIHFIFNWDKYVSGYYDPF